MQEAVIVSTARTAVGKAPNGALKTVRPDEMAAAVIAEARRAEAVDGDCGRGHRHARAQARLEQTRGNRSVAPHQRGGQFLFQLRGGETAIDLALD